MKKPKKAAFLLSLSLLISGCGASLPQVQGTATPSQQIHRASDVLSGHRARPDDTGGGMTGDGPGGGTGGTGDGDTGGGMTGDGPGGGGGTGDGNVRGPLAGVDSGESTTTRAVISASLAGRLIKSTRGRSTGRLSGDHILK
jgi:hypothetical protein